MQTVDISKCIEGRFVRELKNRFLCEVLIDGVSTVCYVPSSCHLGHFLPLAGKRVLLVPVASNAAKTQYALFAVPYKKSMIFLNTSVANYAVINSIQTRKMAFLGCRRTTIREHYIDGYKADLFVKDTNTIIEVKSVLTSESEAVFPTVYSGRTIKQLKQLDALLGNGYNAHFCVVSLNPYVKAVNLSLQSEFGNTFDACLSDGLTFSAFTCTIKDNKFVLSHRLPIRFDYSTV